MDPNPDTTVLHDEAYQAIDSVTVAGVVRLAVDALFGGISDDFIQVQHVERVTALNASENYVSTARDCRNHEAIAMSIYLERDAADTDVTITVEHSHDGVTYRTVEEIPVALTAADDTFKLDRVYSVTRRYYRVRLVNGTANALAATELIVTRKLVS